MKFFTYCFPFLVVRKYIDTAATTIVYIIENLTKFDVSTALNA